MLLKLPKEKYHAIDRLISEINDNSTIVIKSVLGNKTRGKVFVDNIEKPKAALIWAINCMFYLIGDAHSKDFEDNLLSFLSNDLALMNKEEKCLTFVGTVLSDSGFLELFTKILEGKKYELGFRQELILDKNHSQYSPLYISNNNYEIKQMDNCLEKKPEMQELEECILEFWNSMEEFYDNGIGFYVKDKNRIISSCFSCAVVENQHEAVIETYDSDDRNKGYGTIVARAYVEKCLNIGVIPHWGTYETNIASVKVALNSGFSLSKKYPYIEFLFEDIY